MATAKLLSLLKIIYSHFKSMESLSDKHPTSFPRIIFPLFCSFSPSEDKSLFQIGLVEEVYNGPTNLFRKLVVSS